eukprot:15443374-Alexandrium_andersonii.AAC.1
MAELFYDKRRSGARGRALRHDLPSLRLKAGDRVEPTNTLPDIGMLDGVTTWPVTILFWRPTHDSMTHHRNPLFNVVTGISLDTFMVDPLHTLHLGPMKTFVMHALWHMINNNLAEVGGEGAEVTVQMNVRFLRAQLFAFYTARKKKFPTEDLTQMQDLTVKMLGTRAQPILKSKAAETKGLLYFVEHMLAKHESSLPSANDWRGACATMVRFLGILQTGPARLSPAQIQDPL